jgi:hypothetical protein
MTTPNETTLLVSNASRGLESAWRERNNRLQAWYNLRRLVDRWKHQNKTSFVTNRPKVFFNLSRHLLAGNPSRARAVMGDDDMAEQDSKGESEAAVLSIIRDLDEERINMGRLSWAMGIADQTLMGWVNVFYAVLTNEDGSPDFRADIWDNMTVFPEWDDEGLVTVVHKYLAAPAAAAAKAKRLGVTIDLVTKGRGSGVFVEDFWHRSGSDIIHATLINGHVALEANIVPEMDGQRIPVLIVPVNGEDRTDPSSPQENPGRYQGVSILDQMERSVSDLNDMMTIAKQSAVDTANPNYVDYTEDGQGFINVAKFREGASVQHGLTGDKLEKVDHPALPQEFRSLLGIYFNEMEIASVNETVFANAAADTSGVLFSQLQATALNLVGSYADAQDYLKSTIAQKWVEGFRDGFTKPIMVKGRSEKGSKHSGFFFREWNPKRISDPIWMNVETDLAVLRNRAQEVAAMRQVLPATENILDHVTALDELGRFQDPNLILQRIMDDRVFFSDENVASRKSIVFRRQAEFYRQEGDETAAVIYERMAEAAEQAILGQQQGQGGQQQGQGGQPASPGNVPPEAGGVLGRNGISPDVIRQALQRRPPQARR